MRNLYGRALNTMNDRMVISWLFGTIGLKPLERKKRTKWQIRMRVLHGDPKPERCTSESLRYITMQTTHVVGT